jgi:thymidylate synthase (FAD)
MENKNKEGDAVEGELTFVDDSECYLVSWEGSDLTIVEAAVVSTGVTAAGWSTDRVTGLINRLMKDRHGGPFEHVIFRFHIKTPLFTARQLQRHRIASWNEASGRYKVMPAVAYIPPATRPMRQEGAAMDYNFIVDESLGLATRVVMEESTKAAWRNYHRLLDAGVAKEVARMVLPVNQMTEMVVTINLRSLLNFLSLRGEGKSVFPSHPQFEIVQIARRMEMAVAEKVPISYEAFMKVGRVAP